MTAQELEDIAKIVGPALSGLSILFGVIYFVLNLRRDRAKQTLDYWEKVNQQLKVEKGELLKYYGSKIDSGMALLILENGEEAKRLNKLINVYERLSIGVNIGVYDLKTLNRLAGQNIIDNYSRFEAYIEAHREKLKRPLAWQEFQKLVKTLRAIRK